MAHSVFPLEGLAATGFSVASGIPKYFSVSFQNRSGIMLSSWLGGFAFSMQGDGGTDNFFVIADYG